VALRDDSLIRRGSRQSRSDVLYVEIEALGIGKWVDGFGITRHAETHEGVIVFAEL
jgi:hypothetical protein